METTIFKIIKIKKCTKGLEGLLPEEYFDNNDKNWAIGERVIFVKKLKSKIVFEIEAKAVSYVEDNHITGHINDSTINQLNRSIGQYKRNYNYLKIGITGRLPHERLIEHLSDKNWDKMVVLYKTSSEHNARDLERFLIAYHSEDLFNKKGGGGGKLAVKGWNYLYILLK
jgi:hypothetical protein